MVETHQHTHIIGLTAAAAAIAACWRCDIVGIFVNTIRLTATVIGLAAIAAGATGVGATAIRLTAGATGDQFI